MHLNLYRRLNGDQYRYIYVCGDIHGNFTKLNIALSRIGFHKEKDLLVCVGDLIDRGSQNLEVLRLLKEPWFDTVIGNHDWFMMCYYEFNGAFVEDWFNNGGDWFKKLSPNEQEEVAQYYLILKRQKSLILELNFNVDKIIPFSPYRDLKAKDFEKKVVIAHADYPSPDYQYGAAEFDENDILWSRKRLHDFVQAKDNSSVKLVGISGADDFFFGHTIINRPATFENCHYIDTGGFREEGELSLIKIK